jgi:hypothetical protein
VSLPLTIVPPIDYAPLDSTVMDVPFLTLKTTYTWGLELTGSDRNRPGTLEVSTVLLYILLILIMQALRVRSLHSLRVNAFGHASTACEVFALIRSE